MAVDPDTLNSGLEISDGPLLDGVPSELDNRSENGDGTPVITDPDELEIGLENGSDKSVETLWDRLGSELERRDEAPIDAVLEDTGGNIRDENDSDTVRLPEMADKELRRPFVDEKGEETGRIEVDCDATVTVETPVKRLLTLEG